MAAATRIWPGWPRSAEMRGSNGLTLPFERIDRQGAGGDGRAEQPLAGEQGVEGDGGRGLGAVDEGEAFLRAELERLHAKFLQRFAGGQDRAGDVDFPVAHQGSDQMRERSKVAAGADAALARDDRHGVLVEQGLQRVDDQRPNAGKTAAETEQFQNDHQPHDMARQRLAEAGAVGENEVGLQLRQAVGGDGGVGEQAEAGVDAVDRLAGGDDALDRGGAFGDALHRGVVEARAGALPELAQGAEVDGFGIERQCHGRASRRFAMRGPAACVMSAMVTQTCWSSGG